MKKLFMVALFMMSMVTTPWWVSFILGLVLVILFRAYISVLVGVLLFDTLFAPSGAMLVGILSFSATFVVIFMAITYVVRVRLLE